MLFFLDDILKNNKIKKSLEKSEGRSMVEMLGVLAIIGVLSIGGISGYTLAMRRYKANEIMQLMNKYALTTYTACQNKMAQDSVHYPNIYSCNHEFLHFTDAGLGTLPNGVHIYENVGLWAWAGAVEDVYATFFSNTDKSSDIFEVSLIIEDKNLCETVADIANAKERDIPKSQIGGTSDNPDIYYMDTGYCDKVTDGKGRRGYHAHIYFYVS